MNSQEEDQSSKNILTSIAPTLMMLFISTILYSSVISEKHRIQSLRSSTWYEIELNTAHYMTYHVTQFRTGEMRLYIDQYRTQIYEQPCKGFKNTCKAIENEEFKLESATFYSNHYVFNPSAHLVLKSIQFKDQNQQPQTLDITKTAPNHPEHIAQEKRSVIGSFILMFFIFTVFTIVFYTHHIGHHIASKETVKLINKGILAYYVMTIGLIALQLILM